MNSNELLDPFNRLLEDVSSPAAVRAIEAGGSAATLWAQLEESGFLDALVSEDAGGAGLGLADVGALLQSLGRHAVPVPFAETMIARALLADAGLAYPSGAIVFATLVKGHAGPVPHARVAEHAIVDVDGRLILTPLADAQVAAPLAHNSLGACLNWASTPAGPTMAAPACGLRAIAAVVRATAMAGAADRLLEMTVGYANERVQFGKPIGKQQAVQQQMAVMAEHTVAARIAAQIGCAGGLPPTLADAAVAKQITSSAVTVIANTAHAVHGAIGVSEEYDLQLYTRRLHEWRLADGSESYWAGVLGAERLGAAADTSVDFIRSHVTIKGS